MKIEALKTKKARETIGLVARTASSGAPRCVPGPQVPRLPRTKGLGWLPNFETRLQPRFYEDTSLTGENGTGKNGTCPSSMCGAEVLRRAPWGEGAEHHKLCGIGCLGSASGHMGVRLGVLSMTHNLCA